MIPESNTKDLMLRKDLLEAVNKGKFHVYSVKTVDEGIEILTDKKAGVQKADGSYPKGTINYLVNERLKGLAEGYEKFGEKEKKQTKRSTKKKKK